MPARTKLESAANKLADTDASVAEEFAKRQGGFPMQLLDAVGDIGDQPQLRLISGVAFAAGLLSGNRRLMRAGARMLIAHEIATAAKNFVKRRVDRNRPRSADTRRKSRPRPGQSRSKELTSFPSGHTAGSVAVARAFAREFPEHRGPALAAAGVVAIAQVPRCAHYPSDVGAGAVIGAAAEMALARIWPPPEGDEGEPPV